MKRSLLIHQTADLLISSGLILSLFLTASQAQISLDGSFGASGALSGPNYTIPAEVGQLQGSNLFHSFGTFNVHTGESATFTGPSGVDHILSRVTGGNPSTIDGLLKSEIPGANLFLLNPSGLMFGPNARLDVTGSFHASTADMLRFADGATFSARLNEKSRLTAAAPAAFGFLSQNPADIVIEGSELQVTQGKTVSVVGGDIAIRSGSLSAPTGQVNLVSTASAGDVQISSEDWPPGFTGDTVEHLGAIELTQAARLDASGDSGGTVTIRGGRLWVDNSTIASDTLGQKDGVNIGVDIEVATDLAVSNGSFITTTASSAGHAGDIRISAERVSLVDNARILSVTFGEGDGGSLIVSATDTASLANVSFIGATTSGTEAKSGDAGTVVVEAQNVVITDGSGITSSTLGTGQGGTVTITASDSVTLSNTGAITALTNGSGNAGAVVVKAQNMTVTDGSLIASSTLEAGQGGTVTITASDSVTLSSSGAITALTNGSGNAGAVVIEARNVMVTDGSLIDSSTLGMGRGGTVTVKATVITVTNGAEISSKTLSGVPGGNMTVADTDVLPLPSHQSDIFTDAAGSRSGGDITVVAHTIQLTEGAKISAQSIGTGDAGTIRILATDNLLLSGNSAVTTESIIASGGNIQVTAQSMVRLQDSTITATVGGGPETSGGNITIDPNFVILENSQIVSNAFQGQGGNIAIEAGVFLADPTSGVSAVALDSEVGIDGEIDIRAPVTNLSGLVRPLSPGFAAVTELLRDQCAARLREGTVSSLIVRGRTGVPPRPESILPSPLFRHHRDSRVTTPQAEPLATTVAFHPGGVGASQAMRQGWMSFHHGGFEEAARRWQQAVRSLKHEDGIDQQSAALVHLAHTYQRLGHYEPALQHLQAAQTLAEKSGDRVLEALILGELGNVHLPLGRLDQAASYLHDGLRLARQVNADDLVAVILNNLGNLAAARGAAAEALRAYRESARLAELTGNPVLQARALTHGARITQRRGETQDTRALLDQASFLLQTLSPSHETAYGWLGIGLLYADLSPRDTSLLPQALRRFRDALAVAQAIGDARATSYAWGYLGKLYEDQGRYPQALDLTRRALFALQPVQAPEAAYQWQWQSARLLHVLGQSEAAMDAYRQAIQTLQALRHEMDMAYGEPLRFHQTLGLVYAEFLVLLLQPAATEAALEEARQLLESLKVAELQNHFQDECVAALRLRETSLDAVSQTAVVVYPILLPDRTELLVSLPTGAGQSKLQRFATPIGADRITEEAGAFRHTLEKRTTRQYLEHAQTLYDWLIRPFEPALASRAATTLVFVPDGALRTIPMAALHDGEQFLIQKYALAITPGLNLTDPRPLPQPARVLAAGLTQAAQGRSSLPHVATELQAIATLYKSDVLLNQDFQLSRLAKTLETGLFSIVHIASHGQFSGELDDTFILTADDKLTLDRLDQLLGRLRFRDEPVELLTLSACQTAAGDERAALGLAGVAVKAGARSALATLWHINDQASSELVAQFYRHLHAPAVSRAAALQRAQIHLLEDPNYQHPAYWAAFLLINNWL